MIISSDTLKSISYIDHSYWSFVKFALYPVISTNNHFEELDFLTILETIGKNVLFNLLNQQMEGLEWEILGQKHSLFFSDPNLTFFFYLNFQTNCIIANLQTTSIFSLNFVNFKTFCSTLSNFHKFTLFDLSVSV